MSLVVGGLNSSETGYAWTFVPHWYADSNAEGVYIGKRIATNPSTTWNQVYRIDYYNGGRQRVFTTVAEISLASSQILKDSNGNLRSLKSIYDTLIPGGFYAENIYFYFVDSGDGPKLFGAKNTSVGGITTGVFPDYCVINIVINDGVKIVGAGGAGNGGAGGPAILIETPSVNITLAPTASAAGGGGGGGQYSGGGYSAGGGGGAGIEQGAGGGGTSPGGAGGINTSNQVVPGGGGCIGFYATSCYQYSYYICRDCWYPGYTYYYSCGWYYYQLCSGYSPGYSVANCSCTGPLYTAPLCTTWPTGTACGGSGGRLGGGGGAASNGTGGGSRGLAIKTNNKSVYFTNGNPSWWQVQGGVGV
jgi:hypothetical protein